MASRNHVLTIDRSSLGSRQRAKVAGSVLDTVKADPPLGRSRTGGTKERRDLPRRQRLLISCSVVLTVLVFWEISGRNGWIDPLFTSYPSAIAQALVDEWQAGRLAPAMASSAKLLGISVLVSVVTAIPMGVATGWYRRFDAAVDPFLSALYATPRLALIPLIFVWFGIGFEAQVAIVWLGAFFPLAVNTAAGVRSLDRGLLAVARSYQASDFAIFRTLALPGALPYITSGLRLSLNYALLGVVVAEFFAGSGGMGRLIFDAGLSLRTDVLFAGIVVIAGTAMALTSLLKTAEKRLMRWR